MSAMLVGIGFGAPGGRRLQLPCSGPRPRPGCRHLRLNKGWLLKPVVLAGIGTYTSFASGIGCDRMRPPSGTAGIICGYTSFVRSFAGGVNDPELLCARGHRKLAFGEEVVAVAGIEPDFVVTPKVPERSYDRPGMLVDDNGVRVSIGRGLRYSLAGSDCSAPLPFLAAPHNRRRG